MFLQEHTRRGEGHRKTGAEIGVIQPQAKESLELLETGKGKEEFSCIAFGASVALRTP